LLLPCSIINPKKKEEGVDGVKEEVKGDRSASYASRVTALRGYTSMEKGKDTK